MESKKKRGTVLLIALVAVVAIGGTVLFQGGKADSEYIEEAARTGSISTYYSFSGAVEVKHSQDIQAPAPATVRELYVKKGDRVAKEDRLLRLSTGETVKAGIAGEVANLPVEKDDDVQAGTPLISIVDFDDMEIRVKVDEFDVSAVTVGKAVLVTVNALDRTFETVVTDLDKQATRSGDVSYYMATLALEEEIEGLLPGMQVDTRVLNAQVENVTTLSMKALQFDGYNQPYVLMRDGRATKNVAVTVGVNDGVNVEIVSGLRSGDVALVSAKAGEQGFMRGIGAMGGGNGQ